MCSVEKYFLSGKMHCFVLGLLGFLSYGLTLGDSKPSTNFTYNFDYPSEITCKSDAECQSFIKDSKCREGFCKCVEEQFLSSDASKCLSSVTDFGSTCEDNIQCSKLLSSGGICDEEKKKCVCKTGYHYLKGTCWRDVGLSEKCFRNEQCYAGYEYVGLECDTLCKCRKNYYQRLNYGCRRKRQPGQSCNLDSDCGEQQICEGMKCKGLNEETMVITSNTTSVKISSTGNCPKGMFEVEGQCVLELGMPCTQDSECSHIKSATCLDNKACACEPALYIASEDNRDCLRVPRAKIDDIYKTSCMNDIQCSVFGNSFCQENKCRCKNDTYFETKNKFCWAIKSLEESCTVDEDCQPEATQAECKREEKKCLCKTGFHQKGPNCIPDALVVGDTCDIDEDCLFENSFCNSSKVCACKQHFSPEKGKCIPGVGTSCVNDEDCKYLNNTNCRLGELPLKQCLCKENYINSKDYKYCLPVANYSQSCIESFQCEFLLGNLGHCKDKVCNCLEEAHFSYGKCHKSKYIGETCIKRPDCFPGKDINSVICLKGFCSCNYDYELDKTGVCVKTNSATTMKFYPMLLTSLILFLFSR